MLKKENNLSDEISFDLRSKLIDTFGCGHMVQPGRNEEADWSLKHYMLNRTRCACLIISVQSECASPTQVGVDTGYKSKGERLLKHAQMEPLSLE